MSKKDGVEPALDAARVASRLERQCRIVQVCENLHAAASELAEIALDGEALDLWRLPLVTQTSVFVTLAQATASRAWGEQAASNDALLARALRRLAESLGESAELASEAATFAADFAAAERDGEVLLARRGPGSRPTAPRSE